VRRLVWVGAAAVVVAGATAGAIGFGGSDSAEPSQSTLPPATVKVARGTLTKTEDVHGTLGYGDPTAVNGRLPGTVTALPALGGTVQRGEALYRVDASPVVLLYGQAPLYRRLATGVEGGDVAQFERELAALGYQGFTVDDSYTSATADAVRRWQQSLGVAETGAVDIGRVVFAPGPVRISAVTAHLSDQGSGPVLSYTGTSRQVTVKLDVSKQDLVRKGATATVKLPNGTTVPGAVTSVGTVATSVTTNNSTTTTIEVVVTVADHGRLGTYDEAPVDVTLVADERKDALIVPVAALLALAEGGYGVEVVNGSTTRIVAVNTGLFANGKVEISGDGISTDTVVGMPS
jgi:peptidoglycan hydrolase-like protein with peptidoglycan-binding domain